MFRDNERYGLRIFVGTNVGADGEPFQTPFLWNLPTFTFCSRCEDFFQIIALEFVPLMIERDSHVSAGRCLIYLLGNRTYLTRSRARCTYLQGCPQHTLRYHVLDRPKEAKRCLESAWNTEPPCCPRDEVPGIIYIISILIQSLPWVAAYCLASHRPYSSWLTAHRCWALSFDLVAVFLRLSSYYWAWGC